MPLPGTLGPDLSLGVRLTAEGLRAIYPPLLAHFWSRSIRAKYAAEYYQLVYLGL